MKALRGKNIVHRDIKPGNILIKYHPKTGKMMVFIHRFTELVSGCGYLLQIKIADFGFARHFTDEAMKPLDLTSLAGTPVFMVISHTHKTLSLTELLFHRLLKL